MIQLRTSQFTTEVIADERVLSADISDLQIQGFPDQFQLITSAGLKVMLENVQVERDNDNDIMVVTYRPMSPAFRNFRLTIYND